VLEHARVINLATPFADSTGRVAFDVSPNTQRVQVEWAPSDTPLDQLYPYRRLYHLDLGTTREDGVGRRLCNLGFSLHTELADNIRDYQRAYRRPPTGRVNDVHDELVEFHDHGTLPPLPSGPPGPGSVAQSTTRGLVGEGPADESPPLEAVKEIAPQSQGTAGAGGSASSAGGRQPRGSAAQVLLVLIRVRVRTRTGRALANAEVTVDAGAAPRVSQTDGQGFVRLTLVEDDFGITTPRTFVTISCLVRHHGPDPGGGLVKTGRFRASVAIDNRGLRPQNEQGLLVPDSSTPGVAEDSKGRFLDVIMMDAGMNLRGVAVGTPTRRLTTDEVQQELIHHYVAGDLQLAAVSEPRFAHDPASDDLDPCTSNCKLASPAPEQRVNLASATVGGISFFHLTGTAVSQPAPGDIPGQRYTRERFSWQRDTLQMLDQRHAVGIARLCHHLSLLHDIAAIYNVGVSGDTGRADTHGHGLAFDFSGCSKSLPDETPAARQATTTTVRMGLDFIVFLHWGRVPMWNPETVAAHPDGPAQWTRLPDAFPFDDHTNFETVDPAVKRLHYRLDPPPFQVASGSSATNLEREIAGHFAEARRLFLNVYRFFVNEYSDSNVILGPSPVVDVATAVNGRDGHFIIHPDYAEPNSSAGPKSGREAHNNHIHAQLGPTNYAAARRT
jgi:hypothetical protein